MDHDHFLTRSVSGIRKQRRHNLFKNLFQHLDTPPTLITLLVPGLQSFYNSRLNNIHASDYQAINHQRKIGWDNFSRGSLNSLPSPLINITNKSNVPLHSPGSAGPNGSITSPYQSTSTNGIIVTTPTPIQIK